MKERKGPFGVMVGGIVDSVVQGARRRAQDREPRALLYDPSGLPRLIRPGDPGADALVEAAGKLIHMAGPPPPDQAGEDEIDGLEAAEAEAETQAEAAAADAENHPGETTA